MSTLIKLDFETFYSKDYTLRKLTTEAYVRDERFQTLGVGVRVGDAPTVWLEDWEFRAWAKRVDWTRAAVLAHHAHFDGLILSHHYGIRPAFWFCTLSMGRVLHDRAGLADLAEKYGIGQKGHELANVQGLRREDMTQRQWEALGVYCRNDVDLMDRLLGLMRPAFPTGELKLIDMTVRFFTEPTLVADTAVLTKALNDERARKAVFLDGLNERTGSIEAARAALASSDKFADLLRSIGVKPPTKPGKNGEIFAFAKSDPGFVELLESKRDDVRFLAEARLAVKSTIIETRTERMLGIAQRGPVPLYLKFSGAHTHRWSGGDKMNPQNFNRGGALRDALLAPDGYVLVVADSGQIEARVVAWLAGEGALLEAFRRNDANGGDFYSDVGGSFFGKKLSKKETPLERQIAKAMILGLGFGMGWLKFGLELLKGLLGADPVRFTLADVQKFGVNVAEFEARPYGPHTCGAAVRAATSRLEYRDLLIHCAVADYFVRRYRDTNSRITKLWRACDEVIKAMDSGVSFTFKGLTVERHAIRKPGGLVLRYPGLRRGENGWSYMSGHERSKIYGGLLTENLVQSLARDVVAEQALVIRDRISIPLVDPVAIGQRVLEGRIVTTTHDEIVACVPEAEGEAALTMMLEAMRQPPKWCADLPLNADGGIARRYGDAK